MAYPGTILAMIGAVAFGADRQVDFARDVHPVLAAKCFACHSGDKRFGGLSLGTYRDILRGGKTGKVVSPGTSADSLLIRRVLGDGMPPMPPAGEPLTANEVSTLRDWIDQGARARQGGPPAPPNWVPKMALRPADRNRSIDGILGRTKLTPISDAAFARRVYLDIWGLLPTPEQLDAFLARPKRPELVTRLLAHNRNYAEHWMTFWNDLLRNDEGVNYAGTRKSITPWLYNALEENLPYDKFVTQLLNPTRPSDPDGFLLGVNWRGDINASQTPVMQAAQNSAQVFLGVNLKCNSCHDSFISRWKLKDAYGLASFFSEEKLELVRCDARLGEYSDAKFLFPELGEVKPGATLAERRAAAADLFTRRENGRFARTIVNRIWKRLMGRGLVEPVDDMDAEPWSPELLDWLAASFVESGYDLKALVATIVNSRAYQSAASDAATFAGPAPRRLTGEQFLDAISSITGEWRTRVTPQGRVADHVREWRMPSSRLTRALGRPIRDQVFTERLSDATTLQALELVNGEAYARYLERASKKMLGVLEPSPANLFDSGRVSSERVKVDIDVAGIHQIRLLVVDVDSYSPERVLPVWAGARWHGPGGEIRVAGTVEPVAFKGETFPDGLRVKVPSETVFEIAGKGYARFTATVGVEESSLASDISPRIRFFIFKEKPDMEKLVRANPEKPVAEPAGPFTVESLTRRVYRHALSREPTKDETRMARELLADPSKPGAIRPQGLADLIWCVTALPEFQLIL